MRLYRCKECAWVTRAERKSDIGKAHSHAEKHASVWKFPAWLWPVADPNILGEFIEEVSVTVNHVVREDCYGNPLEVESR